MPVGVLDATDILRRREVIEKRIVVIKRALEAEENSLDKLQKLCPHPNRENRWEDNRITYWYCNDCGRYWRIDTKPK